MRPLRLVALVLGAAAFAGCASRYAHPLPQTAHAHRAKTLDGWEIALVQYLPRGVPTGRPVLLCHGISANARHMDLDRDHSLARWLAANGREAWTVSIRGTGLSDGIDPEAGRPGGFTFDTVWQQDTRAAIAYVRAKMETPKLLLQAQREGKALGPAALAVLGEPSPRIDYVGHSMGGMLVYAYLSQGGPGLNAVAILASPTRLDWGGRMESLFAEASRSTLDGDGAIPMETAALLSMPVQGAVSGDPLERLLYNPENVSTPTWRRLVAIGTGDISSALWLQFIRMMETGRFESVDGAVDYRRDMARIRNPVIVFAGKVDRIAPPPAVKDGYRALGSASKKFVLAAEEHGMQADYGHMDFVVGERAEEEIWPSILAFFRRHPG